MESFISEMNLRKDRRHTSSYVSHSRSSPFLLKFFPGGGATNMFLKPYIFEGDPVCEVYLNRDLAYSISFVLSNCVSVMANVLFVVVYTNRSILSPQQIVSIFDIFLSVLAIPDVIVDDQPHHFKTFMNYVKSKTLVSAIVADYFSFGSDGTVNEEVIIKFLEWIITNIRVRMKNDFFFGKITTDSVNEVLADNINSSLACLGFLFYFEIRSRGCVERNNFVSKFIGMGGLELLSELSSSVNNSDLVAFALPPSVSSSMRLPPQMLPDKELVSDVISHINDLLAIVEESKE
jgi:hypothetical protein